MTSVALLLGGSHGDVPLVRTLQGRGFRVVVVGGAPEALGHLCADESIAADYSDVDSVCSVAERVRPDIVVPGSNDFAAITAADVGAALDIDTPDRPDIARLFHNKDLFRLAAAGIGVPVPRQVDPGETLAAPFPVVVKPTDLTGGKGVAIVAAHELLGVAVERARRTARSGSVVVEEFVRGEHHGVSALVADGQVVFCFFDDEWYRPGRFEVGAASSPSTLSTSTQKQIRDAIGSMAREWNLQDGLVHLQVVVRGADWFIIDTCRRIPGDLYVDLVRLATGVDYLDVLVALWLRRPWAIQASRADRSVVRVCLMAPAAGSFAGIHFGIPALVTEIAARGDTVSAGQKVGIAVFEQRADGKRNDLTALESPFNVLVAEEKDCD